MQLTSPLLVQVLCLAANIPTFDNGNELPDSRLIMNIAKDYEGYLCHVICFCSGPAVNLEMGNQARQHISLLVDLFRRVPCLVFLLRRKRVQLGDSLLTLLCNVEITQ